MPESSVGALFGLDACAAALAALFPSLTDVRAHAAPLHTLPVLQDVLTHAAFRRTRTAARFIGEMASTADPAPFAFSGLDGGPARLAHLDALTGEGLMPPMRPLAMPPAPKKGPLRAQGDHRRGLARRGIRRARQASAGHRRRRPRWRVAIASPHPAKG